MVASLSWVALALLRSGETVRFQTLGHSMWPTIPSRSDVEVAPCSVSGLAVGDIAAFERSGQVVIHRVRVVSADGVHFSGDASRREDGCIPAERVLGRARVLRRRPLHLRWPSPRHLRLLFRAAYFRLTSCRPHSV